MRSLLSLALLAFLLAPLALADDAPAGEARAGSPARFFEVFDKDKDGKVTAAELESNPEIFRLLDRDEDGVITPADLSARPRRKAAQPPRPGTAGDGSKTRPAEPRGEGQGPGRGKGRGEGPGERRGQGREQGSGEDAERRQRMRERMREMDKDGDGRVSKDEFKGKMPFERLDRNGDGFLDEKDRPEGGRRGEGRPGEGRPGEGRGRGQGEGRARRPDPKERFKRMDKNGDGFLDAAELRRPGAVERIDQDKDGKVSLVEFEAFMETMRKARGNQGPGARGPRGQGQGQGQGQGRRPGGADRMRRFDANGDGKITKEEWPGKPEHFDRLDKNGDGVLDETDRPKPGEGRRPPKPDAKPEPKPEPTPAPTTPSE